MEDNEEQEEKQQVKRQRPNTFINTVIDKALVINKYIQPISNGIKRFFNDTLGIELEEEMKAIQDLFKKRKIQGGGGPNDNEIIEYFPGVDPLLFEDQDNLILQIFENSKTTIDQEEYYDISNIYYNTSAYYRFIMDLRNVSDINEMINMTVEFVMYRIALWNLDYDYQYFEEQIRELEKKPESQIVYDPVCKKCISQYEYYEAILKYYLLLQLMPPAPETKDQDLPEFDATSDGRDIMCYIMSKPYDMYVKYKNFFSLQYFQASNIDSEIQIKTPQKTPSPPALTSAQQQLQQTNPLVPLPQRIPVGGSSTNAKPQKPKGPLKLLDYHKKYFPAYEKLYYSNPKK